ncbi:MAG: hypothetical protein K1X89_26815 [Myxococcaceae bacterium]|nr:hypothetical protein [Myxococcaceae bacterium]
MAEHAAPAEAPAPPPPPASPPPAPPRAKRPLPEETDLQPGIGGDYRVIHAKKDLGELADLVPADFPWARSAIAVVPGRGRPACCQEVAAPPPPRQGEPVALPTSPGRSGVEIVGTTLVISVVTHAPGIRSDYERGNWRTPGAALFKVPRWVKAVQMVVTEGAAMP